jgi:5'(3')-deoxyribonucleotidase
MLGIKMDTTLKEKIGDIVNGIPITTDKKIKYNNWVDIHNSSVRLNELLEKLKVTPK